MKRRAGRWIGGLIPLVVAVSCGHVAQRADDPGAAGAAPGAAPEQPGGGAATNLGGRPADPTTGAQPADTTTGGVSALGGADGLAGAAPLASSFEVRDCKDVPLDLDPELVRRCVLLISCIGTREHDTPAAIGIGACLAAAGSPYDFHFLASGTRACALS